MMRIILWTSTFALALTVGCARTEGVGSEPATGSDQPTLLDRADGDPHAGNCLGIKGARGPLCGAPKEVPLPPPPPAPMPPAEEEVPTVSDVDMGEPDMTPDAGGDMKPCDAG